MDIIAAYSRSTDYSAEPFPQALASRICSARTAMASTLLLIGSNGTLRGPEGSADHPDLRASADEGSCLLDRAGEVPIGRLSLDIYAEQLRAENARFCRLHGDTE